MGDHNAARDHNAEQSYCTLCLSGGLGNQLFQYAAGRALALRTKSRLAIDLSFYDPKRHREFELERLPIEAELCHSPGPYATINRCRTLLRKIFSKRSVYREPHFHFDPNFVNLRPPVTLHGYFQSYRYFAGYEDQIRKELVIPAPGDAESSNLAKQIAETHATSLHIRRGDYVADPKNSQIYAECSLDYYERAMETIPGADPVLVFSDDIAWARSHLRTVKPLIFPATNRLRPALADLWLMTQARHHIIANSSFSWWGAWLAQSAAGVTIAPRRWFNDPSIDDSDLIPSGWRRL